MSMSLKEVRFDKDDDVYIQWQFDNDMMHSNLGYAFTQMYSLSVSTIDLDGLDLTAIAEMIYAPTETK